MKRYICCVILLIGLFQPKPAKADMFGGDIIVLSQILIQNISQLYQLQEIVSKAQENIALMREIHSGLSNVANFTRKTESSPGKGLYGDLSSVQQALSHVQRIYGQVPDSPNSAAQRSTDQGVSEAIQINNHLFSYADELDELGETIERRSSDASPKGAAKLTVQGIGGMLRAMNQSIRAQAVGVKLEAQDLAMKNQKDKAETREFMKTASSLSTAFKSHQSQFATPRFQQ